MRRRAEPKARSLTRSVVVPSDLARFIEADPRALEAAQTALDYVFDQTQDKLGIRGERLVHELPGARLHAPRPNNARIACAGGSFADHAAAMAEKMRGRPYEGDVREENRRAGFWGFWKLGREIVGPDGELVYPERCDRLDYEGEVAVVLGKRGVDLKPAQLNDYVWWREVDSNHRSLATSRGSHGIAEWEELRSLASAIKEHTLTHLDQYLEGRQGPYGRRRSCRWRQAARLL